MKKKLLFIATAVSICLMFSFSCVLANTGSDAVNGIRNVVGGAENVVENAAGGIANGIKNGTGAITRDMSNTMNMNNTTSNQNATVNTTSDNMMSSDMNAGTYTATRTATNPTDTTFFGLNANTWTWIILLVAAVGIITIIWSYVSQNNRNYDSYDE